MNITLVTIWYDESPEHLYDLARSVKGTCSHIIAVDGAYARYPDATGRSDGEQANAIILGAKGIGLTLHQPAEPWIGDEVEKRNFALNLANVTKPDWLLILDGDERLVEAPNLHVQLSGTDKKSAVVRHVFTDREEGNCRKLYRAPVHIGKWHAEYIGADGQEIYTDNDALWLDDVVVEHRKSERLPYRQENASIYYGRRDTEGIETHA